MLLHLNKFEFENFIEIIIEREDIDKAIFEIKDFIKSFMCKDLFTCGDSNFDIAFFL